MTWRPLKEAAQKKKITVLTKVHISKMSSSEGRVGLLSFQTMLDKKKPDHPPRPYEWVLLGLEIRHLLQNLCPAAEL